MGGTADFFNPLIRARLMQMMDALEKAGGTPIRARDLHAFAYFANVLSPLWQVEPAEGSVLKETSGPYFPALQREIDACIGSRLLIVTTILAEKELGSAARMQAVFRLDRNLTKELVARISEVPDEKYVSEFLLELAFSFLDIPADRRGSATLWDATWSDPSIPTDRVVDFGEWTTATNQNPTWNAAQLFQRFAPNGVTLNRAEKLLMYMRLMKRRADGRT